MKFVLPYNSAICINEMECTIIGDNNNLSTNQRILCIMKQTGMTPIASIAIRPIDWSSQSKE